MTKESKAGNAVIERVSGGGAPLKPLITRVYDTAAEQSAEQPAEMMGCLQDKSAGSEARLVRGAVGIVSKE